MVAIYRSRPAVLVALVALVLGLGAFLALGTAHAAEKPVRGTPACTQIVEANANVQTAQDNVDAANEELARRINGNDTTANINAQRAVVTRAENQLTIVRGNTTDLLCRTGSVTVPAPTTTPSAPAPVTPPSSTTVVVPPRGGANPRLVNCSDFATQGDAQRYYDSHKTATDPDPANLDANGNGVPCENAADGSGKVVRGTAGNGATGTNPSGSTSTDEKPGTTTNSNGSTSSGSSSTGTGSTSSGGQVSVVPDTSTGVSTGGSDW